MAQSPVTNRSQSAAETRKRMIDAAFDTFAERGYHGTTMAQIAKRAGVAEATTYFTFTSKAELLRHVLITRGGASDEPEGVVDRPWYTELFEATDQRRMLALMVEHGTEIFRRLAPLARTVAAASITESAVAEQARQISEARRAAFGRVVGALESLGALASPRDAAIDVIDVVQSAPTYNSFTVGCGWSTAKFKAWSYRTLTALLSPLPTAEAVADADAAATEGLSFHPFFVTVDDASGAAMIR